MPFRSKATLRYVLKFEEILRNRQMDDRLEVFYYSWKKLYTPWPEQGRATLVVGQRTGWDTSSSNKHLPSKHTLRIPQLEPSATIPTILWLTVLNNRAIKTHHLHSLLRKDTPFRVWGRKICLKNLQFLGLTCIVCTVHRNETGLYTNQSFFAREQKSRLGSAVNHNVRLRESIF